MAKTRWLYCKISEGMFPTERSVVGEWHNGKKFSLFAPEEAVRTVEGHDEFNGAIKVEVCETTDGLILVKLPAQTFENGQFAFVREDQLAKDEGKLTPSH